MKPTLAPLALTLALLCPAFANYLPPDVAGKEAPAKKKKPKKPAPYVPPIIGSASDTKVTIEAIAYLDHGEMQKVLGHDPGEGFLIVQVKFARLTMELVSWVLSVNPIWSLSASPKK